MTFLSDSAELEQGLGSNPDSATCHYVTASPCQFPYLQNRGERTCSTGWPGGFNELKHVKCLEGTSAVRSENLAGIMAVAIITGMSLCEKYVALQS